MTTKEELNPELVSDSDGQVYRYGTPDRPAPATMSQGRVWSDDDITVGICPEHKLREFHFVADRDMIAMLKPGYGGVRSVNSDKKEPFSVAVNEMCWLPKGTEYYLLTFDAKEAVFINCDKAIRDRFVDAAPFQVSLDEPVVPFRDLARHSIFMSLAKSFVDADGIGGRLRAQALLDLVLYDVCAQLHTRHLRENTNTICRPVLDKIRSYVEENLSDDIKLEALADIADMSVYHFSRMFRNTTGVAPYRFVMQRRITRVQGMLATTSDDIASIAAMTGYSSQSHLTSAFKKTVGITPGRFRQLV